MQLDFYKIILPLSWICGIFVISLLYISSRQHENWCGIACFILMTLIIFFYMSSYVYFAGKKVQ